MKKLNKNIFLTSIGVFSFSLTSCFGYGTPSTFIINDVTYKTGFYDTLYPNSDARCFVGDTYEVSDDVWDEEVVEIGDTIGRHISFAPFDMYTILVDAWRYELYVSIDDYDETLDYYSNYDNYHYYYGCGELYNYKEIVELPASKTLSDNLYSLLNNHFKTTIEIENMDYSMNCYFFYKISKDGLLTTLRDRFYIIDHKLYKPLRDGMFYEVDSTLENYFINLIVE
ncbi:MAG: hypothetical protein WC201_00400 [Bacilli bacterium]